MAIDTGLENPILNSPFDPPTSYFVIGPHGPTGEIKPGRRPSESFIPVPVSRKGKKDTQQVFDFDTTGERRELNSLINDIRREVEWWRSNNWNAVTPYTRKLLAYWAAEPPTRDEPVLFCQREAAETAIFLVEVAGRRGPPLGYQAHVMCRRNPRGSEKCKHSGEFLTEDHPSRPSSSAGSDAAAHNPGFCIVETSPGTTDRRQLGKSLWPPSHQAVDGDRPEGFVSLGLGWLRQAEFRAVRGPRPSRCRWSRPAP